MMIDRRRWNAAMLGTLASAAAAPLRAADPATTGRNILRVALPAAETGFDPVQVTDLYSHMVNAHIFEPAYQYDALARPVKRRPQTAAGMPEVSSDYRTWTVTLQRGIHFADDPAFKGRKRELVAEDYVYAIKRYFDPATKSPGYSSRREEGFVGLEELRQQAIQSRQPFDYDKPVDGARALDRYTFRIQLAETRPRFLDTLCEIFAVAREVVEHYGDAIMGHPVGTGPYRLKEWRRSSAIVLEKSPHFRDVRYDAEPPADDAEAQAILARYKGRRLPFNDGVELVVVEQSQPRWLSFLNGELDVLAVPAEFTPLAAPNGELAPNLAKRGITMRRYSNPDVTFSYFNMDDPVVGGYTPEKVALRRAIELAYDIDAEIRNIRRGQAIPAQTPMVPGTFGHDPALRTANGDFDPARAKALLDLYGYVDRDGDGWRDLPDGRPLVLNMATQASSIDREFNENWQRSMRAVGIRMNFNVAQWPENLKAARAGKLQMWGLGSSAGSPDGQGSLGYMYGPAIGSQNLARFKNDAFDKLYDRMQQLPDGPERAALFAEATKIIVAYMPYRMHAHRINTDLAQPWIRGYRRSLFRHDIWQYTEVDGALRAKLSR